MVVKMFTYGTLRTHGKFHTHNFSNVPLKSQKATLKGYEMFDSGYGYPIAVANPDKEIVGELFEFDNVDLFNILQRMEEDAFYKTVFLPIVLEDGTSVIANCFVMDEDIMKQCYNFNKLIEANDWYDYKHSNYAIMKRKYLKLKEIFENEV